MSKREVDPFRGERQAEELAKRRARVPETPGVDRLEFSATDRGSHYEVTIRGYTPEAGPPAFAPGGDGGRGRGRGRPDFAPAEDRRGGGLSLAPGFTEGDTGDDAWLSLGPGPGAGADVVGMLDSRLSVNELRRELSRNGHHYPQTASRRELARRLAHREPERARRLLGM